MKRIVISFAAAWLAGCAASPIETSLANPIPAERILNAELTQPKAGTGSILFKRDWTLVGSGCELRLFVNGKAFADMQIAEKIQIYLPPGKYLVGAKGKALCDVHTETEVLITEGKTEVYRVALGGYGEISLHPTAF